MTTFTVLDPTSLDSVTGGTGKTVPGNSATSHGSDALVSQLSGLQSSIKDLAAQKPQSAFGGTNTVLLFALLAAQRPAASTNVVYVRRGYW